MDLRTGRENRLTSIRIIRYDMVDSFRASNALKKCNARTSRITIKKGFWNRLICRRLLWTWLMERGNELSWPWILIKTTTKDGTETGICSRFRRGRRTNLVVLLLVECAARKDGEGSGQVSFLFAERA
jgi:hypothetical protein